MREFNLVYISEHEGIGVFGAFMDGEIPFCVALTHAYAKGRPIVGPGSFLCQLGTHVLDVPGAQPFQTYEIKGIDGHSGLLFHPLNKESESKGCIGLGESFVTFGDIPGIADSRTAFGEFMKRAGGDAIIQLNVRESLNGSSSIVGSNAAGDGSARTEGDVGIGGRSGVGTVS